MYPSMTLFNTPPPLTFLHGRKTVFCVQCLRPLQGNGAAVAQETVYLQNSVGAWGE